MPSNTTRLRLLIIADFALAESGPLRLEGADLGSSLENLAPTFEVSVPNRLVERRGESLNCKLRCTDLPSFSPAAVARSLPALEDFLSARRQVSEDLAASTNDLAATLAEMPQSLRDSDLGARLKSRSAPPKADDRLSALLHQVELPGEEPAQVLADLRDEIDRRLTRQIATVLAAPRVRSVEAAWRGLAFLLEQGAAESMEIELLSTTKDEFLDTFFEQAFHREYEGKVESPLAAVVLCYAFERTLPDLERLGHAARMGESLRVPFFASMGASYFGLKRLALVPNLPDLPGKSRGAEYAKWNGLRDAEHSLWLTLILNRFLLRDAWGAGGEAVADDFMWVEESAGDDCGPLWGEGSWALGAVLARALGQGGLRLPMTAVDLEGLPCRPYGGRRGEPFPYPLEVRLVEDKSLEMAECGLVALVAEPGEHHARFPYLPTYHRARVYTTEEATRSSYQAATLPYQLFAALASRQLQEAAETLPTERSDVDLQQHFEKVFSTFLGLPSGRQSTVEESLGEEKEAGNDLPEAPVTVEVDDDPENWNVRELTVRLKPPFEICGGAVDLVLGIQVPR